jgi:hypothetical protein
MHVNPSRFAAGVFLALACLSSGLLVGMSTGGGRSDHLVRVERVTKVAAPATAAARADAGARTVTTAVTRTVTRTVTLPVTVTAAGAAAGPGHHPGPGKARGGKGGSGPG